MDNPPERTLKTAQLVRFYCRTLHIPKSGAEICVNRAISAITLGATPWTAYLLAASLADQDAKLIGGIS